jgi:predicted SnoaL-like aldol condensation-catalyzing enzyme
MDDPKKNRKVVEEFLTAAFINHDLSDLGRFLTDEYIQHNPDVAQGRAGFEAFFMTTFKAMPDFRYTIKQIVADGDRVWV